MQLKNKLFNKIIEIFIKENYFNYNFLISSFENENYSEIFNIFFKQMQIKFEENIKIEKYEFFGENITTDEIREISSLIQNSNLHEYYKFIILYDIEKISQNAINTLLKTIEEPNSPTIFFFTTKNIYSILPTIKSRCFQININYLKKIFDDVNNLNNTNDINEKNIIDSINVADTNINFLIKKDKNTKDEENKIENYIQYNFLKLLKNRSLINKTLESYEKEIKKIREFHCNKKHLFNKTLIKLLKLKTAAIR